MKVQSLKSLFSVALMGVALTGCSTVSEPEKSTAAAAEPQEVKQVPQIAPKPKAEPVQVQVSKATTIEDMSVEELKAFTAGKVVNFEFDRSDIQPDFYETIRANALLMSMDSSLTVTIGGHCDERGSREYNLALGERRGNAVRDALIAEGVAASRINVISYGEDSPVDNAHNESAWSKNRRAEFNY